MWHVVFDMGGGLDGKRPEPMCEIGIKEHSSSHRRKGEVATLSHTVLGRRIRDGFFISDACRVAVSFEFAFDEFRSIVNLKYFNAFAREILGDRAEESERLKRFVTRFQKI